MGKNDNNIGGRIMKNGAKKQLLMKMIGQSISPKIKKAKNTKKKVG